MHCVWSWRVSSREPVDSSFIDSLHCPRSICTNMALTWELLHGSLCILSCWRMSWSSDDVLLSLHGCGALVLLNQSLSLPCTWPSSYFLFHRSWLWWGMMDEMNQWMTTGCMKGCCYQCFHLMAACGYCLLSSCLRLPLREVMLLWFPQAYEVGRHAAPVWRMAHREDLGHGWCDPPIWADLVSLQWQL